MTTKNIIELIVMLAGIFFSAFFSSSETAIISINKFKLRQLEEKNVKNAALLRKLVEDNQNTITTILVGNNIVNIITTTVATLFFYRCFWTCWRSDFNCFCNDNYINFWRNHSKTCS